LSGVISQVDLLLTSLSFDSSVIVSPVDRQLHEIKKAKSRYMQREYQYYDHYKIKADTDLIWAYHDGIIVVGFCIYCSIY